MAKLSISEAARQAGISRQYLYSKYINTGKITVSDDESGNKYIDDSELLRVFDGRLPKQKQPSTKTGVDKTVIQRHATPDLWSLIAGLETQVKGLLDQLEDKDKLLRQAQDREQQLNQHITQLNQTISRLTTPRPPDQKQIGWLGRLLGRS